ncbi:MAG: hypothetical protein KatS3mg108_0291 [Isosphaeraceae bacterium]|jgi:hypothetical protein|nr:MAG: hypothetical protein KatS3mg108_0291 [Isosphaeraceae bacterium]
MNHLTQPTPAFLLGLALLLLGLLPTTGPGYLRATLRSLHSLEANRSDSDRHATGYYVGLIDGDPAGRDELTRHLIGKPSTFSNFAHIGASRFLPNDPLQFELIPNIHRPVASTLFTTNSLGQRDRPYHPAKPPNTLRILLLGASIDMGWGVDTEDTYENMLEDWLNHHAQLRRLHRRFEIHNLAMAAYSPLHRLHSFLRKGPSLQPDLVLIALNRLDLRLLQIHLVSLLQQGIDPGSPAVHSILAHAGLDPANPNTQQLDKESIKAQLQPLLPQLHDAILSELADHCRAAGLPLIALAIPRASENDSPDSRLPDLQRLASLTHRLHIPFVDLMPALDDEDPADVEIAPWDDHPNTHGHKLIFRLLAQQIVQSPHLYRLLFATDPIDLNALRTAATTSPQDHHHDQPQLPAPPPR